MSNSKYLFLVYIFLCLTQACKNNKPTFSNNIASIVYKKCTPCHQPGQIGHFDLLTYDDAVKRKQSILYVVKNNIMPPWPADVHYSEFANQISLTEEEKSNIISWIENNCPIGDKSSIPTLPNYSNKSYLGKPDYSIPVHPQFFEGDNKEKFLLVKVPFEINTDSAYVSAIEFVPGNTKVVHHVNGDIVIFENGKKKNVFEGIYATNTIEDSTVRNAYKEMGLIHDDNSFPLLKRSAINYLPGVTPYKYPNGIGTFKINKKNAFLLSDIHYGPTNEKLWDSSYINIFLTKQSPKRAVIEFQMGTLGVSPVLPSLILPPNKITTVYSQYKIDKKISVLTINPHMHLLGKSFKAFAVSPKNDTIKLIHIPKWDFNWQFFYTYKKPIVLEAGTTIYAFGEYDNTAQNINNPNSPPKVVKDNFGSMRTTDEMFQFIISYMDYENGDEEIKLSH